MLDMKRKYISGPVESITGLPPEQSDTFASILYAIIDGLGLQKVADPTFKYDEAYGMLAEMVVAYYEQLKKKRES
jgi:hypothetical protein